MSPLHMPMLYNIISFSFQIKEIFIMYELKQKNGIQDIKDNIH